MSLRVKFQKSFKKCPLSFTFKFTYFKYGLKYMTYQLDFELSCKEAPLLVLGSHIYDPIIIKENT